MTRTFTHLLVVGVPGLCFMIAGVLNGEYPAVALGGVLIIGSVYGLSRKRVAVVGERRSFILAGIIGASLAVVGFGSHRYWLAAAATLIFIGSLLRLYGSRVTNKFDLQ